MNDPEIITTDPAQVTDVEIEGVREITENAMACLRDKSPSTSTAPFVRWCLWQEKRGLHVLLELLRRNAKLGRENEALKKALAAADEMRGRLHAVDGSGAATILYAAAKTEWLRVASGSGEQQGQKT